MKRIFGAKSSLTPELLPEAMAGHWRIEERTKTQGVYRGKATLSVETDRIIPGMEKLPDCIDELYWHFCDGRVPKRLGDIFGWESISGSLVRGSPAISPFKEHFRLEVEKLKDKTFTTDGTSIEDMANRIIEADGWLSSVGLAGLDESQTPEEILRISEEGRSKFIEAGFDLRVPV